MEEDDEYSRSPVNVDAVADGNEERESRSPRSESPEPRNVQIGVTLALPIQTHRLTPPSGVAPVSGGREDCWSEEATAALIEAWGERYSEQSRGIVKQKQWEEVAEIVNGRAGAGRPPRSYNQCKNRMDSVKRKYKSEKAKIASGAGPSTWIFFNRLDRLLGNPTSDKLQPTPRHGFLLRAKRPVSLAEDSDPDSSDSLPPANHHTHKRSKIDSDSPPPPPMFNSGARTAAGSVNEWRNSVRELTRVIFMFSKAYEEAESEKLRQMMAMEKERMKFAKEIEIQRMKFLMKTQLQISRLGRGGEEGRHVSKENGD